MPLYFVLVAILTSVFLALTYFSRRVVLLLVLNGIAITQLIGCVLMELGFPGFDIPEIGHQNGATLAMLCALIAINVLALLLPVQVHPPEQFRDSLPRDSTLLLTAAVVVLSLAVGLVTVALGAPLLEGANEMSRVTVVNGHGAVNYFRSYIIPVLATVAWYQSRYFARASGRSQRVVLLLTLTFNGVLIASKSSVVSYPIIIVVIELMYYFQRTKHVLTVLRTWLVAAATTVTALSYMVLVRFLHAAGELSLAGAANSLGLRLFVGQGNIYWKIFTDPGGLRDIGGDVWLNVFNIKYLLSLPPQHEFFRAVSLRYTNDYFAEYWNLVAGFLGEPVLLFGYWAIPVYVIVLFAIIAIIHQVLRKAVCNNDSYLIALAAFYAMRLIDYWQMGGLYNLFSLKHVMVALLIVAAIWTLRQIAMAFGESPLRSFARVRVGGSTTL